MTRLLIKGGTIIDPSRDIETTADLLIEGGKIVQVGSISDAKATLFDADGAVVAPSFVDMHVHLREPGREDEETIASGSAAAALGGFTTVCAMPNTDPVCDNASVAEKVFIEAKRMGLIDVLPAGSITKGLEGKQISAIGEMVRSAAKVRLFTDDGKGVQDSRLLRRAMEYIKGWGAICAEHCDDAALSESGQMHEGEFSDALGLKGIPSEAEDVALARDLALARLTGVRFHALHVSTAGSVELIRKAKANGVNVTAECTPHHLSLTDSELVGYNPDFKVNPPLRSQADVDACRAGIADGTIDAIATDHAPHSPEEKELEFELAPPGMLGLETALAVCLTELVDRSVIDLKRLIQLLSVGPSRILGLDDHGGPIEAGAAANLVVFDPTVTWTVEPNGLASLSRNTPWAGKTLKGKVLHTFLRGEAVVASGKIATGALV